MTSRSRSNSIALSLWTTTGALTLVPSIISILVLRWLTVLLDLGNGGAHTSKPNGVVSSIARLETIWLNKGIPCCSSSICLRRLRFSFLLFGSFLGGTLCSIDFSSSRFSCSFVSQVASLVERRSQTLPTLPCGRITLTCSASSRCAPSSRMRNMRSWYLVYFSFSDNHRRTIVHIIAFSFMLIID